MSEIWVMVDGSRYTRLPDLDLYRRSGLDKARNLRKIYPLAKVEVWRVERLEKKER